MNTIVLKNSIDYYQYQKIVDFFCYNRGGNRKPLWGRNFARR